MHIYGARRDGAFKVLRHTEPKRLRAKVREVKVELKPRINQPVPAVGKWLRSVVAGHLNQLNLVESVSRELIADSGAKDARSSCLAKPENIRSRGTILCIKVRSTLVLRNIEVWNGDRVMVWNKLSR